MVTNDVLAVPNPTWARFTLAKPAADALPDEVVYGSAIPGEADLKLIGDVDGKRVLDLGCGAGHNAVRLAQAGAKVIAVEPDLTQLAAAREAAERADVKVELHHAALHELAFLRADGVDVALSAYALAGVPDLARVLRQVHRVLRQEAPLVLSLPHPALELVGAGAPDPLRVRRSWFDDAPRPWQAGTVSGVDHPRTVSNVFATLSRNNYRVDALLEPPAEPARATAANWADVLRWVPPTLLIRARKQGI